VATTYFIRTRGKRRYELSNHLGNVQVVVSDRKIPIPEVTNTTISYFTADIVSATDYYAFGAVMPDRSFNAAGYRYGFNGKENDNEVKGTGNEQDYGMRIYDDRIGRFLSIDLLTKNYPWYTPYQFAGNKPIWAIDLDGLEEYIKTYSYENGKATLLRTTTNSEVKFVYSNKVVNNQVVEESVTLVKFDKRTGKPFEASELGTVQYQYLDKNGKQLNITRDLDGKYVTGSNDIMPLGENNIDGSIYIGPTNPTVPNPNDADKPLPDYRREPQDEVDAAAMVHDQDYDTKKAAGAGDAFLNKDVSFADKKLVDAAHKAVDKGKNGGMDNVTGKPVTKKTQGRGAAVATFFSIILTDPNLKGKRPPPAYNPMKD
jgi:RHS repeat-associated protein